MLTARELLPEQQEVEKVVEETVGTESEAIESEEQATAEEFAATKTESEEDAEKNSSEASTDSTAATEEKKAALAYNILWSGMWGTAPATLDIEGVLTVGEGTLTTTVDQVIPIAEVSSNMTIRKVVLTAPVVLPADVPALRRGPGQQVRRGSAHRLHHRRPVRLLGARSTPTPTTARSAPKTRRASTGCPPTRSAPSWSRPGTTLSMRPSSRTATPPRPRRPTAWATTMIPSATRPSRGSAGTSSPS